MPTPISGVYFIIKLLKKSSSCPNNNRGVTHQTDEKHLNNMSEYFAGGLIAKSVPAGTKNFRSEGFLLAKHLKHTAHKHHHHEGAVCASSSMVLLDEHTPSPGASAKGVGQGRRPRVLVESIN